LFALDNAATFQEEQQFFLIPATGAQPAALFTLKNLFFSSTITTSNSFLQSAGVMPICVFFARLRLKCSCREMPCNVVLKAA
jgi:hypothetical protein